MYLILAKSNRIHTGYANEAFHSAHIRLKRFPCLKEIVSINQPMHTHSHATSTYSIYVEVNKPNQAKAETQITLNSLKKKKLRASLHVLTTDGKRRCAAHFFIIFIMYFINPFNPSLCCLKVCRRLCFFKYEALICALFFQEWMANKHHSRGVHSF